MSCTTSAQQQQNLDQSKAERKPFAKSSYEIRSPTVRLFRESANGQQYDPGPKAVLIDEKTGKYEFRWIGTDGKEKIVAYQRKDAIEAIIEARTERDGDGRLLYRYIFRMLPDSPAYFTMFIVQTLANDALPVFDRNRFLIGRQSSANPDFAEGVWWNYSLLSRLGRIDGGKTIEFQMTSASLPGVVRCRAVGGALATKGVGEEIPSNLVDEIPILDDAAWGYTIAPVEGLSTLTRSERAKYLIDSLPKFRDAGWMSEGTAKNYELILANDDLPAALKKAEEDLKNAFITTEVFQIIDGLSQ